MSAGKGSRPRPVEGDKFRESHERIFPRRSEDAHEPGEVIDGAECIGGGAFHLIDHREDELRGNG